MTTAVLIRPPHGGSRAEQDDIGSAPTSARRDKAQTRGTGMKRSWQVFFQENWIRFLKANFHTPEQIGVAFGVTAQTAQNWLDGTTMPRGPFVAWAFLNFPSEAGKLIEQDECENSKSRRSESSASSSGASGNSGSQRKQRAA